MKKRTIFFDLDDTLYERATPYRKAFSQFFGSRCAGQADAAFEAVRRRGDAVFRAAHTGQMPMEEMYIYRQQTGLADVGISVTAEQALELQALYAEQQRHIALSDTMCAVLDFCRGAFSATGIITNGSVETQGGKLESLGIARWVRPELTIISDAAGVMKPDPAIFRLAEQAAGCGPEDCIFVGDSPSQDMEPAAARGWTTVWVDRGREPIGAARPAYTVRSEQELLDCLRTLGG